MASIVVILAVVHLSKVLYPADDFLGPQNDARALVGVPALSWDDTLAAYARNFSNRWAGSCSLRHSDGPYGENLFWGSANSLTAADAVAAWLSERQEYDYNTNSCRLTCGQYTQVVWRTTTSVGCARADCGGGGGVLMVCEYHPRGNFFGDRPY